MEIGSLFPATEKRLNRPHFASMVWMDVFVAEQLSTMLIMSTNFIYYLWTAAIVRSGPGQAFCRGASVERDKLP
jgi:hypothetical protein